jgi:hypothetical protein
LTHYQEAAYGQWKEKWRNVAASECDSVSKVSSLALERSLADPIAILTLISAMNL